MIYSTEELKAVKLDGRYQDIGNLPSNFLPYKFRELYIRPFTIKELRLVSKAAVLKEQSHLLRALDLVISEDIHDISIGDFYYLLMWLRIHSMPKTPYVIEWHCNSLVYVDRATRRRLLVDDVAISTGTVLDAEVYSTDACRTHNSEVIHMTDVEIISLDEDIESLGESPAPGVELDFPRVRNLVEIQEAMLDPELRMIVGPAQWIKADTLANKIAVLEAQPDLDVFDTVSVVNEQIVHGIRETAVLTCRGCGIKRPHALTLDALSFFR